MTGEDRLEDLGLFGVGREPHGGHVVAEVQQWLARASDLEQRAPNVAALRAGASAEIDERARVSADVAEDERGERRHRRREDARREPVRPPSRGLGAVFSARRRLSERVRA